MSVPRLALFHSGGAKLVTNERTVKGLSGAAAAPLHRAAAAGYTPCRNSPVTAAITTGLPAMGTALLSGRLSTNILCPDLVDGNATSSGEEVA